MRHFNFQATCFTTTIQAGKFGPRWKVTKSGGPSRARRRGGHSGPLAAALCLAAWTFRGRKARDVRSSLSTGLAETRCRDATALPGFCTVTVPFCRNMLEAFGQHTHPPGCQKQNVNFQDYDYEDLFLSVQDWIPVDAQESRRSSDETALRPNCQEDQQAHQPSRGWKGDGNGFLKLKMLTSTRV